MKIDFEQPEGRHFGMRIVIGSDYVWLVETLKDNDGKIYETANRFAMTAYDRLDDFVDVLIDVVNDHDPEGYKKVDDVWVKK